MGCCRRCWDVFFAVSSEGGGAAGRSYCRATINGDNVWEGGAMLKGNSPSRGSNDPRLLPAYPVSEAAHDLRMPEETLRSWVAGRLYPVAGQSKRSRPLIHLDDPKRQYLSFINLVEAHVLAAIRRRHGVKLPKVRNALDYVRREFRVEHPLINQSFQTDGLDLFVERYGELINASREGQRAMKEIIGVYLKRIEWDAKGLPIRLYPFTRITESEATPG